MEKTKKEKDFRNELFYGGYVVGAIVIIVVMTAIQKFING